MTPEQRIELAEKLSKLGVNFSHHETPDTSSWRFHTDGITMYTGDGGALEMLKVVEAESKKQEMEFQDWESKMQEDLKAYYRSHAGEQLFEDISNTIRDYFYKRDSEKNSSD